VEVESAKYGIDLLQAQEGGESAAIAAWCTVCCWGLYARVALMDWWAWILEACGLNLAKVKAQTCKGQTQHAKQEPEHT